MPCSMVKLYDVFIGTVTSIIRIEEYVTCKKYGVCISKWQALARPVVGEIYMKKEIIWT